MTSSLLEKAARAYGIALSYNGADGKTFQANPETVKKMVFTLAATNDLQKAWDDKKEEIIRKSLPPVVICWNGIIPDFWIWADENSSSLPVHITDENEKLTVYQANVSTAIQRRENLFRLRLSLNQKIQFGYYDIEVNGKSSLLISAPEKAPSQERDWGVFAPVHALQSDNARGIGGYKELADISKFISSQGGKFIGTLPLLAVDHESENSNHSPYSPSTRLFWDEIYLDIDSLPGYDKKTPHEEKSDDDLVDYARVYQAKKKIIQEAADHFFQGENNTKDYDDFTSRTPFLDDYAKFMSKGDPVQKRYHLYAQYACHRQLSALKKTGHADLYLDYPVGVHTGGFDAAHFSHLFIDGFSVGAPPDPLGIHGQNWGFGAMHPAKMIEDRFSYVRASVHNYFKYAARLRIDHIMGLYRLYCIPHDAKASDGAYIHYPFDALMAVFLLEAHRHQVILIGENLGTVPEAVNEAMSKHHLLRMWIAQFAMTHDSKTTFETIEPDMIAGMNTHDLFPFEAYIKGHDLEQMEKYKLISTADKKRISAERSFLSKWNEFENPYFSVLEGLAKSSALSVIINMEDLWSETLPQNIPGTVNEYPNWRRKFSQPIENWTTNHNIRRAFSLLNEYRKNK